MAIVYRDGRKYVYHSMRCDGKVTSVYLGSGELAELAERLAKITRIKASLARADQEATEAKARRRLARQEKRAVAAFDAVETTLEALLVTAGFHRPNRGPWRKQRGERTDRD
jgi:hypothetical protein